MNKGIKSTIIGIAALTGLPFVPIIPTDSQFVMAYQTTVEAQECGEKVFTATSTPVIKTAFVPCFDDTNGDGKITVGISVNNDGDILYYQIDELDYDKMRGVDGAKFNPKRKYLESLIDKTKPSKAEAAIAYVTGNGASGSSVTSSSYPVTVAASDRLLAISNFNTGGDTLSSVDYNGTSATFISKVNLPAKSEWLYLYYVPNPATGTNNVNLSYSSTIVMRSNASLYSGTALTGIPEASTTNTATASTSVTTHLTTISNNAWVVMTVYSDGGDVWGSTGATTRNVQSVALGIFDNGAPKTPAGVVSMTATSSLGTWGVISAAFGEPAVPSSGTGQFIIFD